jgi:Cu/Ag efflux protein CusF
MTRRITLLSLAAVALAGCGAKEETRRYPMQGTIKGVDSKTGSASIDAGKIGDWMEAMTMEYPIQPQSDLAKLHVGDRIEATVVVTGTKYHVTDIKVLPK